MALIPFNRFCPVGTEFTYVQQAINQLHISGDGPFTRQCSRILEELLGGPSVLLTTSCTHALEMAAMLLDLKPGDEIVIPSFTFVSTVNAFVLRGAMPVFADIRPDTLNLDESRLADLIGERTRAIVAMHYGGVGCEMDAVLEAADAGGAAVVEDNAHGLFGRYRGRNLGALGSLATLSFHETKNISCGEGGALLINDPKHLERAEILREKGTDRSRFFRGQVDKYSWVDIGSSYLPSDILAAFLYAQLERRASIQEKRQQVWNRYYESIEPWARSRGVGVPFVPSHCEQAYHLFYLLMPSLAHRQRFIEHLKSREILSVFHYVPLHLSAMGRRFGGYPGQCPVTESVSDRLVRLPFYNDLSEADQQRVIAAVKSYPAGSDAG